MRNIRRCQLRKEDVLATLDQIAVDHHRSADARLPERQIEYVMQTKRDQGTLHDTKYQRTEVTRSGYQAAERKDTILHDRPGEIHRNTNEQVSHGRYNRNEP